MNDEQKVLTVSALLSWSHNILLLNKSKTREEFECNSEQTIENGWSLSMLEYAFYTALEVNNSAVAIISDEILKHIAQELLSTVRNSTTIDWTILQITKQIVLIVIKVIRKIACLSATLS